MPLPIINKNIHIYHRDMNPFQYTIPVETPCEQWIEIVLNAWISQIEYNFDKYSIVELPTDAYLLKYLAVKYAGKTLFYVQYFKKYPSKGCISAMLTLRAENEGSDLLDDDNRAPVLSVNDHFEVSYNSISCAHITKALMDVLPVRESQKVRRIMQLFQLEESNIVFDSLEKRYVLHFPTKIFSWQEDKAPAKVYKYMTLDAFISTLENNSFRMHSIISQSDITELFYLGDYMCGEYGDWMKHSKTALRESHVLISSFTPHFEDVYMWKEYANKSTGVCLGFEPIGDVKLHQVQYIDEAITSLKEYQQKAQCLKEEGINIYFAGLEKYHRFVKNSKFKSENEWRLIVESDEELKIATYNGVNCVEYHDFPFHGNELPQLGLRLDSVDLGSQQPINNFSMLASRIRTVFGSDVVTNWSIYADERLNKSYI